MAETIARIQLLIDTTANWQAANPILLSGEIGLEIKPNHEIAFKVGNGTTSWNLLDYAVFTPSEVVAMRDELQDQIDNIVIAASEGGDSSVEVSQARVNASGVTYATLKARLDAMDATAETNKTEINAEITDLKSDLSQLNTDFNNYDKGKKNYIKNFVKNKIINITSGNVGTVIDLTPLDTTLSLSYTIIDVTEGDEFNIKVKGTGYARAYCFIDSSNNVVLSANGTVEGNNFYDVPATIKAPKNAVKLISNTYYDLDGLYFIGTTKTEKKIENLNKDVTELDSCSKEGYVNRIDEYIKDKNIYTPSGAVGTVVDLTPANSSTGLSYIILDVTEGDTFELKVKANSNARAYVFIDDENKVVLSSNGTAEGNDFISNPIVITTPKNAVKLISHNYYAQSDAYIKAYTEIYDRITTLENKKGFDVHSYKVAMPNWSGVFDWEDKTGYRVGNDVWDGKKYEDWYNLFHNVFTSVNNTELLEEIDIGSEYNGAKGETTPSYITDIASSHGAIKMYHVKPFVQDGSNYTVKHKKLKLMIVSGIHGSEKKSIYDNYLLLNALVTNTPNSRALTILRNFCDIYIVPIVNVWGVENNARNNKNINLNRDFAVNNWIATSDSGTTANSQWETRVLCYQIDKIMPDVFIDHHTSSGDANTERGKFVQWGDSDIKSILSLIEENIIDVTPYIRNKFPSKFENYNHIYGHTDDTIDDITLSRYGTCQRYAYQKCGSVAITYEVVMHLKWEETGYIFGYDEDSENNIVSMNYFGFINMIMKLVSESAKYINDNVEYSY